MAAAHHDASKRSVEKDETNLFHWQNIDSDRTITGFGTRLHWRTDATTGSDLLTPL